jgi:hypothetical protein
VLGLPEVIGLADATGAYEAVSVRNGGREVCADAPPETGLDRACKFVYPTSFKIRAGQSVRIELNGSWWSAGDAENSPSPSPTACAATIADVNRAEFPFPSGSIEFSWDTVLDEVCTSSPSLSVALAK